MAGGPTGTRIVEHLTEEGILNDFVRIREESRTSTAVVDPTSGEQTEINEHGPHVTEGELELFVDKLLYLAKGAGGLRDRRQPAARGGPRSLRAPDRRDEAAGVTTLLDAEGEPMRLGIRRGPNVVSPNELESEGLVGYEFSDDADRRAAVREMIELGAGESIMTLADGCLALLLEEGEQRLYRATLESLEPVSTVGSGDAFLAGFVAARYGGRGNEECCASRLPAGPSRPSISGPVGSSRGRSSGSFPRFGWRSSRAPALGVG